MQKLWFLYFARLDKEKWFDVILEVIQYFAEESKNNNLKNNEKGQVVLPFQIFVFGNWTYEKEILELSQKCQDIYYFGFQPLWKIRQYLPNCHYLLMPSTFLETFGLSAVNALSWGIPVVGYKKWGLTPFVFDEFNLYSCKEGSTKKDLIMMIKILLQKKEYLIEHQDDEDAAKTAFYEKAIALAEEYTQVWWEERLEKLMKEEKIKAKKFLLVTDFKTRLGGIETYVHDTNRILTDMEFKTHILWAWIPKNSLWKLLRYWGVAFGALFNLFFAFRLLLKIVFFKPDLIWFHSTLRRIGWLSFLVAKISKAKKWFMFHDMGYFHAFPSKVYNEKDIKTPLTRKHFSSCVKQKWFKKIFVKTWVFLKFLNVKLIQSISKKTVDLYLVPSEYMENIVHKSYRIPVKKVKTLGHFIQD